MVPMVDEIELEHDNTSPTFNNGAFMVYERLEESIRIKSIQLIKTHKFIRFLV